MVNVRALPMGDRAFLLEADSLDGALSAHAALAASARDGVVDLVPAARTVLVRIDPQRLDLAGARAWAIATASAADSGTRERGGIVEIDVVYDGSDLVETADLLGLAPDELIRRHSDAEWSVAFTGFAPGFGYLVSDAWDCDVPRLASPRTRVPAGAVGLAGGFTGAYPRETPGGWRLIGTTAARLFDADAASPALLAPGSRVRFRQVDALPAHTPITQRSGETAAVAAGFRVVHPGLLATIQDLGRPGVASLGVATSGALDRGALRIANRLVGNAEDAAGVEITMGGFRATADADQWIAVTGAWGPIRVDGRDVDPYRALSWPAGTDLEIDWFDHGARAYLAVRGGLVGQSVMGSVATDVLARIGPEPLRSEDHVDVHADPDRPIPVAELVPWGAPHDDELEIELAPGARADWFAPDAEALLYDSIWTVSGDSDRVGMRLEGPELVRTRVGELPSEGMVAGAIQVPPSGQPTILLADGPVTGGYPVIAVVTDATRDRLAQARPGTRIRFRHTRPR